MLEWRPSTIADIKLRLESDLLPHVGEERLSAFDIRRVTAVKTTLLKESRRIAERLEAGVVGLRIDEACRARRLRRRPDRQLPAVGHAKTPAGVRTVQLTPDSAADLERYLQMTSERAASRVAAADKQRHPLCGASGRRNANRGGGRTRAPRRSSGDGRSREPRAARRRRGWGAMRMSTRATYGGEHRPLPEAHPRRQAPAISNPGVGEQAERAPPAGEPHRLRSRGRGTRCAGDWTRS